MANKLTLKEAYDTAASVIINAKLRRANWLQRIILKKLIDKPVHKK